MNEILDRELRKICRKNKLMGANVALYDRDNVLYSFNYGYVNRENQIKSTNDSLYMIGSNTKVMTAMCILKLMEEGLLSLEDDIRKFIPEFEVKATFDFEKITIANLLMHRSGLIGDLPLLSCDKSRDFRKVIAGIRDTYLVAPPGKMFAYSNVGYTVLGVLIERLSGMTYPQYIQQTIAEPLGIGIHFLQTAEEKEPFADRISLGYTLKGKAEEEPFGVLLPAGSNTYMSIADYVKFGQVFLKKDGTVLKKETLTLMETLECVEPMDEQLCNAGYGLLHHYYHYGDAVGKILGHGGDTMFHHSLFYYAPEQNVGLVILTNSQQAPNAAGAMGSKAMLTCLEHKGIPTKRYSYDFSCISADCDAYVGKYATLLGILDFQKDNRGGLTAKLMGHAISLRLCEDGFWKIYPRSLLLRLPPFKEQLQRMRLKFAQYRDEKVLIQESRYTDNVNWNIVGCTYEETEIPETFRKACGRYELTDPGMTGSGKLCVSGDALEVQINISMAKGSVFLKAVSDELAFIQGYGRNARASVTLTEENGVPVMTWAGLRFQKVMK